MPGSSCLWWTGAVSARGHGRFWLGESDGRDIVVIAHRFAWALKFGVEDLQTAAVLGHRCDTRCASGSRGRARTMRDLLRSGATGADLAAALGAGLLLDAAQLPLWDDESQPAGGPTLVPGEDELLDVDLVGAAR